jgi:outer membrane protein assembly factor BamC
MIDRFHRFGWLVAACAAATLSGCSWTGSVFSSDKVAYETAQTRATPLEVPPDLSQLPRDERFVIPDRPQTITASGQNVRPGGPAPAAVAASVAPAGVVAKLERQGNQRWLAVNMPPERAWPVVVEFWPTIGMQVEKSDPKAGIMETAWAENRAKLPQDIIRKTLGRVLDTLYSTGEQDKYRARIERTPENTSEIYISHRGMIEVYTSPAQDSTRWQPRPSDPELEAEVLQRLQVRFDSAAARPATTTAAAAGPGAGPSTAAAGQGSSTAAPAAPQVARVVKGPDGHSEWLEIDETFDRAWRRVGLALDRGAFTVEDRDRGKGIYFVRYLDPDYEAKVKSEQGFLTKLFSREKPVQAPQFRVVVSNQGPGKTFVTVENSDGKPERSVTGDRILNLVNEQLR